MNMNSGSYINISSSFLSKMDGENSHFSISMSSWNYELSSSIIALLKRVDNHDKQLPLIDILYKFLSSRVFNF